MNEIFNTRTRISIFDGIVESLLTEGLITSYDINKLQQHLKKNLSNIKIINPTEYELENHNFSYKAYSFLISVQNIDKNFEKKLTDILNVYGYYINKKINKNNVVKYQIEPRYPIKINNILKEKHINWFYHISPTSNLKKIQKIGLSPRGSETTFYHPDDRIYLINCSDKQLKSVIRMVAVNKKLDEEDFTVFKIDFDDNYNYYLDEYTTIKNIDIIACFVLKNITSNKLEIVK